MMLTLVVNTNVDIALVVSILNGAEMRVGGSLNFRLADLPCKPPSTFRVARLLNGIFVVEVVHTNLCETHQTAC
jgi:hypothetical protein